MKVYKRIAIVCLIAGIILCVLGISMSGVSQLSKSKIHVENYVDTFTSGKIGYVNEELSVDPYSDASIELSAVKGKIVYYDGDTFKVEAKNVIKDYTLDYEDHELDIVFKGKSKSKNRGEVTLYIPRNYVFGDLNVELNATTFTVEGLSSKTLTLEHNAGSLTVNQIICHQDAEIENNAGNINLVSVDCKDVDLENNVGSITAKMVKSRQHYDIDQDGELGSIHIDGSGNNHGEYKLSIDNELGDIDISFEEEL